MNWSHHQRRQLWTRAGHAGAVLRYVPRHDVLSTALELIHPGTSARCRPRLCAWRTRPSSPASPSVKSSSPGDDMNEFMDTVDPRIERAFKKNGVHRRVHMPTYTVWWGLIVALAIILVAVATIFA